MKPYLFLIGLLILSVCKASAQKVVHVVLEAPPNAHHFGDGYNAITLKNIDKANTDTIKITEVISSYKITDTIATVYLGDVSPNQKLKIILKDGAKEYLDAMLKIEYKGKDLPGMKILAIGRINFFEGQPQIIITDPNLFTIIEK